MTEAATAAPQQPAAAVPAEQSYHLPLMLTDKDRELIKTVQFLGIPRTAATCLVAITRYGDGQRITGYWLDRTTDLRQPEVSIGTKWLTKEGILRSREDKSTRKGRPVHVYSLVCKVGPYLQRKVLQKEKELVESATAIRKYWPEAY